LTWYKALTVRTTGFARGNLCPEFSQAVFALEMTRES